MATVQEYVRKLSTTQLQALLREECENRGSLTVNSILDICEILAERKPGYPTVKDVVLQLCKTYLE